MAVRVLEETGLLPHLNPGVMSWQEMHRLKPVAPSMGMMLETTSTRLFTEKGQAHYGSPDKDPAVRLRVLEDAGRLNVPFTTGLLVGIGETPRERAESIFAIRRVAREYGAVQEVIVQNFRAKPDTAMRHEDDLGARGVPRRDRRHPARARAADARAGTAQPRRPRRVRGAARRRRRRLRRRLAADPRPRQPGAARGPRSSGSGRSPAAAGFALRERLTVHPEYVRAGEPWIDPRVSRPRRRARRPRRAGPPRRPPGRPALAGAGRRRSLARAPGAPTCTRAIDTDRPHRRPPRRLRLRLRLLGRRSPRPRRSTGARDRGRAGAGAGGATTAESAPAHKARPADRRSSPRRCRARRSATPPGSPTSRR